MSKIQLLEWEIWKTKITAEKDLSPFPRHLGGGSKLEKLERPSCVPFKTWTDPLPPCAN